MQTTGDAQTPSGTVRTLLTARQVQEILHIDRSTVYRMAETGRLPAIRVGKQWRFRADEILAVVADGSPSRVPVQSYDAPASHDPGSSVGGTVNVNRAAAEAVTAVAAELLGVMMLVTDMDGHQITPIANPCPWFTEHGDDPEVLATCIDEWHQLAENHRFDPEFRVGAAGFECARVFIRSGRELTGMVLAGGVCPIGSNDPDLFHLTDDDRSRVLRALPRIAAAISRSAITGEQAHAKENES